MLTLEKNHILLLILILFVFVVYIYVTKEKETHNQQMNSLSTDLTSTQNTLNKNMNDIRNKIVSTDNNVAQLQDKVKSTQNQLIPYSQAPWDKSGKDNAYRFEVVWDSFSSGSSTYKLNVFDAGNLTTSLYLGNGGVYTNGRLQGLTTDKFNNLKNVRSDIQAQLDFQMRFTTYRKGKYDIDGLHLNNSDNKLAYFMQSLDQVTIYLLDGSKEEIVCDISDILMDQYGNIMLKGSDIIWYRVPNASNFVRSNFTNMACFTTQCPTGQYKLTKFNVFHHRSDAYFCFLFPNTSANNDFEKALCKGKYIKLEKLGLDSQGNMRGPELYTQNGLSMFEIDNSSVRVHPGNGGYKEVFIFYRANGQKIKIEPPTNTYFDVTIYEESYHPNISRMYIAEPNTNANDYLHTSSVVFDKNQSSYTNENNLAKYNNNLDLQLYDATWFRVLPTGFYTASDGQRILVRSDQHERSPNVLEVIFLNQPDTFREMVLEEDGSVTVLGMNGRIYPRNPNEIIFPNDKWTRTVVGKYSQSHRTFELSIDKNTGKLVSSLDDIGLYIDLLPNGTVVNPVSQRGHFSLEGITFHDPATFEYLTTWNFAL